MAVIVVVHQTVTLVDHDRITLPFTLLSLPLSLSLPRRHITPLPAARVVRTHEHHFHVTKDANPFLPDDVVEYHCCTCPVVLRIVGGDPDRTCSALMHHLHIEDPASGVGARGGLGRGGVVALAPYLCAVDS